MNERRTNTRQAIQLNVILYHDKIGQFMGKIRDISKGGMFVDILDKSVLRRKFSNELLVVKPANMDVLFNMQCLRVDRNFISLKFME